MMFFAKLMITPLLIICFVTCLHRFADRQVPIQYRDHEPHVTVLRSKSMTAVGVMMSPVSLRAWQMFHE
jgi:hypothetical protein